MHPFILWPAAPWLIAGSVIVVGLLAWFLSSRKTGAQRAMLRGAAGLVIVIGGALCLGAAVSAFRQSSAREAFKAPGKMVDVGGYKVHVWCRGPVSPVTTLIIPGGYSQGAWRAETAERLARTTRSCLIDRGGLGWSEVGPYPLSVEKIVRELHTALVKAGEKPPYVVVGHSYGGIYAANFAHRFRKDVAGIVLLDPTAPGWIAQGGASGCPAADGSPLTMLGTMFGLGYIDQLNPLRGPQETEDRKRLGKLWEPIVAWEMRPSARWAQRSAMDEVCRNFYSIARTPGILGDTPLLLVPQTPDLAEQDRYMPTGLSSAEQENYRAFNRFVHDEMAQFSSNSKVVLAPPGAGHGFPDTHPDFTDAAISEFIAGLQQPQNDKGNEGL